ncbi:MULTISPECIES: gas vesicle accessory protein GvpU [Bacillaceae]|uniref:gas vesicle accessory protein GvpU n=1 Tax=Bacillaceae TaxID=186817 RepID=UPI001C580D1E|nr:gas vesicle accessory protein GvpU [Rossellomorea sp. YZS02]MBW3110414.1 gas vesicle protein GvpU [Bacillus sp. MCCB 382]MDX8345407.1 gas vesicle accessory protein GvpU [Rossellomorea sp. YZS02]
MSSGPGKDSILEFFVQASNKHDFSLDITLNVAGAVITGTLVSAKEYFDSLSETFEDGSDVAQKLSEELAKAGESVEENQSTEANFIHLKNTKVYCGDSKPTPSKGKIMWRGKISEVDGFFLGKIAESKSSK